VGASRLSIARVFRKDKLAKLQHDKIFAIRTYPATPFGTEVVLVAIVRLLKNHH